MIKKYKLNNRRFLVAFFPKGRKGISPVVATALLLVVAVVSVVGFASWFDTFKSNLFVDVEQQGSISNLNIGIEALVGDTLYFRSGDETQINLVTIDGVECSGLNGTYSSGMQPLNVSTCLDSVISSRPEIVVVTNRGILSKYVFLSGNSGSSSGVSSLDCSALPGDWIEVPGNSYFGTNDFCVMKYEAKALNIATSTIEARFSNTLTGYQAYSSANQTPWVSINFTQAINACGNLGQGYRLITNREWMTIARNAENNSNNWNSSIVGNGGIFRGNVNLNDGISCGSNSVLDGNTDGTNCLISGGAHDGRNKRILELSNNEEIWDLSGNVLQWVDLMENGSTIPSSNACGSSDWFSFYGTDPNAECTWQNDFDKIGASDTRFEMGPLGNFSADYGVGRIYSSTISNRVLLRGGGWYGGPNAGLFSATLSGGPSGSAADVGFRCSYTP